MSDCEVTLLWSSSEISLPSGVSLVWDLCVCLAFLLPSCERILVWLPRFFSVIIVVAGAAFPDLAQPFLLAPGCKELLSIMFA